MNYFNIGICDDEEIILDKISQLINDKFKEINCDYNINKFINPMDLIEYHSHEYFDIVFLDIDVPINRSLMVMFIVWALIRYINYLAVIQKILV